MSLDLTGRLQSRIAGLRGEGGAAAAEYALLLALIAAIIVTAATALGFNIGERLQEFADALQNA
jgi:Flp pilus assembly pilin Flp